MQVIIDTAYLTVEEYAKRSGLSVSAVRMRCKRGQLPLAERESQGEKYLINNALLIQQALERKY
jgi:DNA-directed RNA polymerase specialized sigma24 family protein